MVINTSIETSLLPSNILRKDVHVKCPICHKPIFHNIDKIILKKSEYYPIPHLVLHGDPLHGIILYIDARGKVRAIESVNSIEQIY